MLLMSACRIPFQKFLRVFVPLLLLFCKCSCFEPVTVSTIVGGLVLSTGFAGYNYMKCRISECCDDTWIKPNFAALEHDLTTRLHGQHLVNFSVSRSLRGHLQNKNPRKALVMAFHGWTGSGKNHVSKMIVENLFKNGAKSSFVHWYISTYHFPHTSEIQRYKDKLHQEIPMYTKLCGRSVFIFDEIDKMPPGVIDALKPYIDYHEEVDGVDYRRNIFIFLSNTGGSEISKLAYDFWMKAKDREEITLKHIEPLVNNGAFNEIGGLRHSEIIEKNLIDVYVPFLPLERTHVKLCIHDELNARHKHFNHDMVNRIADQLQYWPPELKVFSNSGCKKVSHKVDVYGDDIG